MHAGRRVAHRRVLRRVHDQAAGVNRVMRCCTDGVTKKESFSNSQPKANLLGWSKRAVYESFTRMREGARACEGGRVSTFSLANMKKNVYTFRRLSETIAFKAESNKKTESRF